MASYGSHWRDFGAGTRAKARLRASAENIQNSWYELIECNVHINTNTNVLHVYKYLFVDNKLIPSSFRSIPFRFDSFHQLGPLRVFCYTRRRAEIEYPMKNKVFTKTNELLATDG